MKLLLALTLGFFYVFPVLAQAPDLPEDSPPPTETTDTASEDATMEPMPDISLPPDPPTPSGKGPN